MGADSPYWLRYLNRDLVLPCGRFVIGRSSACDLPLDDPLASRQHAVLSIDDKRVTIEDLGSRNGVSVNGMTILEPTSLGHADRITIGRHDLFILEQSRLKRDQKITQVEAAKTRPGVEVGDDAAFREVETTSEHLIESLIRACHKAFAEKDSDASEAAAAALYVGIRSELMHGRPCDPKHLQESIRVAIHLVKLTRRSVWLDRIFEIYTLVERVMPSKLLEQVLELAEDVGYGTTPALSAYLESISDITLETPRVEQGLLKRLATLNRD